MDTTFDASFDKALADATDGKSEEASPETVEGTPEDQAPEAAIESKEAEVAETEKTSVEEKEPELAQPPEGSEDLLTQEEYDKFKDNPQELRKALNKAFTQKTQALSEQRKSMEPYQNLVENLKNDPQATVRQMARELGIQVEAPETKQEASKVAGQLVADLKADLGPDLEFLADKLGPALERITSKLAGQAVEKEIEPLKQQTRELQEKAVTEQVEANLDLFTKKYPDWKKSEAKMTDIGSRLQPMTDPKTGKPPTWMEYMEDLYFLATKDARDGDIAKQTVERMQLSAEKSETSEGGVASSRVKKTAPKGMKFDEAFNQAWKDAQDGVVYD
jgi:hypothetical protein